MEYLIEFAKYLVQKHLCVPLDSIYQIYIFLVVWQQSQVTINN